MTTRCPSGPRASFFQPSMLLVQLASLPPLILTPIAVLAAVLGAWRFGAAPGWTNDFSIAGSLLWRYQVLFGVAIDAENSGFFLNRWVAKQKFDLPAPAPKKSSL